MADFEKSIYTGANIMWSFNTSNWIQTQFNLKFGGKKIQENCLTKKYKNNNCESEIWLQKIVVPPFLNAEEISDCFTENFMAHCPNHPKILKFCNY